MKVSSPWIYSPRFDLAFIIAPAFIVTSVLLLFHEYFSTFTDVPLWAWVIVVMGIDVSHVYSTLFRTYFDRDEFRARRTLFILIPLLCWVAGIFLYALGSLVFWRTLAYLAVWHFIRQQYGFMMIYRRQEPFSHFSLRIDQAAVYLATLYPLIYWHTHPRKFEWMIPGDFLSLTAPTLGATAGYVYLFCLTVYVAKEVYAALCTGTTNIAKHLLLLGTALSWYLGIVLFNGDMAFTLTNVVSHGIPYIALIWIFQKKKKVAAPQAHPTPFSVFSYRGLPIFLFLLLLFSYSEEWLWDQFVWRERGAIFGEALTHFEIDTALLMILIPLLAVPQATHYVLDAFIWRINKSTQTVRSVLDV